jgi:ferric-dicitrate binding protein FerR (iron transport regulator)
MHAPRFSFHLVVAILLIATGPAATQSPGCVLEDAGGRQIIRCGSDVRISAEAGAAYQLLDRDGNGNVDRVELRSRALLLDVSGEPARSGFDVVAPHAIAAVRGTRWAVDAEEGRTSVFVIEGSVAVERRSDAAGVVLLPGEGVDIDGGSAPLTVRRWPAERVEALLDRLGE